MQNNNKIQLLSAVVLTALGCVMLIMGFMAPPIGEIHPSILVAFGETMTFVGAIFGINYKTRNKQ